MQKLLFGYSQLKQSVKNFNWSNLFKELSY